MIAKPLAWPSASLRTYLVAAILLATLPIAALVPYQIFRDAQATQDRIRDELQQTAAALAASVDRELAATTDALTILSMSLVAQRGDPTALALAMRNRLRQGWADVLIASAEGRVLYSTSPAYDAVSTALLQASSLRKMRDSRQAVVSDLASAGPLQHATAVTVPVIVDGEFRYVLGAWIDSTLWRSLLVERSLPGGAFASLFDRKDQVIARTLRADRAIGSTLATSLVGAKAGRPAGLSKAVLLDGSSAYVAWEPVPQAGWGVAVALTLEPLVEARVQAVVAPLATAFACLLLGIVLALLVARRVTVPLRQLATKGQALPPTRIPVREIALLRDALLAARTQDERAREALQKKADEFETLFNSSPIGLAFAQDAQCRTVLHNAAMDAAFGPPSETGASVRVLHAGTALEPGQQPLQRAAAHGETTTSLELELIVEGQPPKFVLANAAPLLDASGRPRGAIGAVIDITDRKLTEARLLNIDRRLRESQRLVDLAQEAGHVGFFHYHFEQDLLGWTPGQAKLFGIEVGNEEGPPLDVWAERVDPADRTQIEAALRRMLETRRETETLEFRVTLPDGRSRWLSNRLVMSYDDDASPLQLVGITVDMTDQKQAEHERDILMEREQAARLDAEAANRAKDEFLAMLGHELRNPLSAISSAVEVLNRVDANTDTAANARTIIHRQTRNLAHLMDDLLDVARVISGKILLSRQPLHVGRLVERLLSTMQITGATALHTVELEAGDAWVDGDATRIEQIVNNLVTNAIKYTPPGGRIDISVRRVDAEVRLDVRDTGVGIPAALLPRVFDLFVQGERTLDRRAGGLGIGLTLVRRLVELHGGSVEAESSSAGSVFRVRFPAIEAPPSEQRDTARCRRKQRRVAVIEDNEDALNALRSILELMGHSVTTASDGEAGLAMLLDSFPDVAVVDIGLPGLTGLEVAKKARSGGYTGRMIALSGYGQAADVRQAMVAGFDAYLVKPVDSSELEHLMEDD